MIYSFAPMEGVTSYIYRRIHARMFPGADVYYAPFIAPDGNGNYKISSFRDTLPENNPGMTLVPQLLCSSAAPFISVAKEFQALGYEEINLNVGCPSGTVVSKHKGSGMLRDLAALDGILADIFAACPIRVSVKTRMGFADTAEFPAIAEIYRKYPISRLIVHSRDRAGMYKSRPDVDGFASELRSFPFPVEYNGDVFSPAAAQAVLARCTEVSGLMIGRGAVANPALFRMLRGGKALEREELQSFHDALLEEFLASGLSPVHAMARLKELWFYMQHVFPGESKAVKAVFKSKTLPDYRSAVAFLFSSCAFDGSSFFSA